MPVLMGAEPRVTTPKTTGVVTRLASFVVVIGSTGGLPLAKTNPVLVGIRSRESAQQFAKDLRVYTQVLSPT